MGLDVDLTLRYMFPPHLRQEYSPGGGNKPSRNRLCSMVRPMVRHTEEHQGGAWLSLEGEKDGGDQGAFPEEAVSQLHFHLSEHISSPLGF